MIRCALVLVLALTAAGCASLPDTIKAVAKDNASVCVAIDTLLYGRLTFCRTNAAGGADIVAAPDGSMRLQHVGGK